MGPEHIPPQNLERLPLALGSVSLRGVSLTQVGRRVGLGGSRPQRASPISNPPAPASLPPSGPSPKGGRGSWIRLTRSGSWLLPAPPPAPPRGQAGAPPCPRAVLTNSATASHAWLLMD